MTVLRTPDGMQAVNVTLVCGTRAEAAYFSIFPKATGATESAIGQIPQVGNLPTGEKIFSGVFPGVRPGDLYGHRVSGPWDPDKGDTYNAHKVVFPLLAAAASHTIQVPPLTGPKADSRPYAFALGDRSQREMSEVDSGPWVPKGVVVDHETDGSGGSSGERRVLRAGRLTATGRPVPTAILELNPRTLTSALGRQLAMTGIRPGTLRAMGTPAVISYLATLGFPDLEFMPTFISANERHLKRPNIWGYNNFGIAIDPQLIDDSRGPQYGPVEFRRLLRDLEVWGMGVYADVAPAHTAEGDFSGISLSLKLLGNREAYRLHPGNPKKYLDFSGCLNAVDTSSGLGGYYVFNGLRLLAQWYPLIGVPPGPGIDRGKERKGRLRPEPRVLPAAGAGSGAFAHGLHLRAARRTCARSSGRGP
ncbi:MAG: hypothetical protein IPG96_15205 [Proteobacteria bacterium]|nr:hypothetical protein [Pseudomonadota bacterium]